MYAITFGQKYNQDTHPIIPTVTGYSYLLINADNEDDARRLVVEKLGNAWAFMYEVNDDFWSDVSQFGLHEVKAQ